jgi:hypothetical protein
MNVRRWLALPSAAALVLAAAACGGAGDDVGAPEPAVPIELSTDDLAVAPVPPAADWLTYANSAVGFRVQHPPHWQLLDLPPQGDIQGVSLQGPEGAVDLLWGQGFGGACPEGLVELQVADGVLTACYAEAGDGSATWEQIGKVLGGQTFGARARTVAGVPGADELIRSVFRTLAFD